MESRSAVTSPPAALVVAGWILVALTVVFPPLALGATGVGVVVAKRGRFGTGVAIVVCALLAAVVSIYLAGQTIMARD